MPNWQILQLIHGSETKIELNQDNLFRQCHFSSTNVPVCEQESATTNLTSGIIVGVGTKHWREELKQFSEDRVVNTTTVQQSLIISTQKHVFEG